MARRDGCNGIGAQFGGNLSLRLCPVSSHAVRQVLFRILIIAAIRCSIHEGIVWIGQQTIAVLHRIVRGEDAISIPLLARTIIIACLIFPIRHAVFL